MSQFHDKLCALRDVNSRHTGKQITYTYVYFIIMEILFLSILHKNNVVGAYFNCLVLTGHIDPVPSVCFKVKDQISHSILIYVQSKDYWYHNDPRFFRGKTGLGR